MKKWTAGKLKLSRETVRLLDQREMAEPVGGVSTGGRCSICTNVCSGCRPCL
jgi:hypothetical protein